MLSNEKQKYPSPLPTHTQFPLVCTSLALLDWGTEGGDHYLGPQIPRLSPLRNLSTSRNDMKSFHF